MGKDSAVPWTDHTYNEWIGCTEAGPGCDGCYARALDFRYQWGVPKAEAARNRDRGVAPHWGPRAPRHRVSAATQTNPDKWNADAQVARHPAKVFASSLSDILDNAVPTEWRASLWDKVQRTPWLRWILVTKRIGNADWMLPAKRFDNAIMVATVVTQEEVVRDGPKLAELKASGRVRAIGLSIEPQIELIHIPRSLLLVLDWVISGGESAQPPHKPRPYDIEWPRHLAGRCSDYGVAFFEKQLGSRPKSSGPNMVTDYDYIQRMDDRVGETMSEWPPDLRVRQYPDLLVH